MISLPPLLHTAPPTSLLSVVRVLPPPESSFLLPSFKDFSLSFPIIDRSRALVVLKTEIFTEYFTLYNLIQQEYRIIAQDTYNIDEKGFVIGIMQQSYVFIPTSKKDTFL
jgi:hypothetical protein